MTEFPGVLIVETLQGPTVYLSDNKGEVGAWSFGELKEDPKVFLECLTTLMNAARYGPESARQMLKDTKELRGVAVNEKVCCNVCEKQFVIGESIFRTPLSLPDRIAYEYQCSEKCYESRKLKLSSQEIRGGLIRKLKEIYKKPIQTGN